MSRCYPYPPPGYSLNKATSNSQALIDSIKLQRERAKAKAERKKEKKREKKEKKRETKEKANKNTGKEKANKNTSETAHVEKAHKQERSLVDSKSEYKRKRTAAGEQLEKSDLTEEHGQPVCLQKPSYSSDSTQNSNKRRRHDSSPNITYGNVIRFRFPSAKHEEPNASASKDALCSSSRMPNLPAQQKLEIAPGASREVLNSTSLQTNINTSFIPLAPEKEPICSTSGRTDIFPQVDRRSVSGLPSVESLYHDLIQNWVPPLLQSEKLDSDEEWLFCREEQKVRQGDKRFKSNGDVCSCGPATIWPRAQFLPQADIYALPYTVPY